MKARSTYDLPQVDLRYTHHQVLRGTLPDAEDSRYLYLIKACSELKLTYQIKMCAYLAKSLGKKVILQVPAGTKKSLKLAAFIKEHSSYMVWKRSP
jgi:hypothetical protein